MRIAVVILPDDSDPVTSSTFDDLIWDYAKLVLNEDRSKDELDPRNHRWKTVKDELKRDAGADGDSQIGDDTAALTVQLFLLKYLRTQRLREVVPGLHKMTHWRQVANWIAESTENVFVVNMDDMKLRARFEKAAGMSLERLYKYVHGNRRRDTDDD